MSLVLGLLRPLDEADGLVALLYVMTMLYFAFVAWRSGGGRLALVLLIAVLAYGSLEGVGMLMHLGAMIFPYTSGSESFWMLLWSGSLTVQVIKLLALVVAGVAFLKLAMGARKSRRA